jgi:uncharacterized protein
MKTSLIIFFSVFFVIYFLLNYYIFIRGYQAFTGITQYRLAYAMIFWTLAMAYILSRFVERSGLHGLHHVLYWIGSAWFAVMLYFFLTVVLIDLIKLFNTFLHFLPTKDTLAYQHIKLYTLIGFTILIAGLLSYGVWNAFHPVIKKLEITVNKDASNCKELNIAMVSDIHMGSLIGKKRIEQMVNSINALHPDIVLFAGDILDEVQDPIIRENTGEPIKKLNAPLGLYGITGNHEYIGGINRAVQYINSLGIKLLRDTALLIDNSFWLAGREDKDIERFTEKKRKDLNMILTQVDHSKPLILMDHQPFNLQQSEELGVDLHLSGHTHHGQMWPLNLITNKVYEVSWGYKQKGNTHIYVSCGYGFWGPQVRIGNRPEIVSIKIKFR